MRSSNLPKTLAIVLLLSGCAPARKVTLSWSPSDCKEKSVLTYSVYRGTFKGQPTTGSPEVALIASGIAEPKYVDAAVVKNTWYYYRVQTVCVGFAYRASSKLSDGITVYVPKKVTKK